MNNPTTIDSSDPQYPRCLKERLGEKAPKSLAVLGNAGLLVQEKTALFCSVRCPEEKMPAAYDAARRLRDDGVTVISGFHSPVEKECLRILLDGKQPIIMALPRSLDRIRPPKDWRGPLDHGRLLLLSPLARRPRRPDRSDARRRNEMVTALADEILIVHAEPGGSIERIAGLASRWKIRPASFSIGGEPSCGDCRRIGR